MTYQAIIKNGTIIDGTGNTKPRKTDVAIKNDKIVKIGQISDNESAKIKLNAEGLFVAPGFIDLTTHSDNHWTLFSQPNQESFVKQGITTILGGHGGSSLAPAIKREALQSLAKWVDIDTININWQSTKEFLKQVDKTDLTINFATLTGHETLRRNVLASKTNPATKEQIEEINELLENSLKEGSFGLSASFGEQYSDSNLKNELSTLLETTAKHKAISSYHIADEGKNLMPTISKIIVFLRKTGAKGHIAHFKALGREAWGNFETTLAMIKRAQKENIFLTCDFFPYTSTGSNLISFLPGWILSENKDQILKLLKESKTRQNIIDYLKKLTLHYDKITIASAENSPSSIGKNISQISKDSELSEEEVVISLLETNDLRVSIFSNIISEENIEILAQKPYSMIGSDGVGYDISKISKTNIPHPRSFGSFPRAISHFVKEKNILNWENIIYKMSGLPAQVLGITNRGALKEDSYADVVVFNPETIKDNATRKNPFQYSSGIDYVFINGKLSLADNKLTENRAGKALRKE